ncbi:MAG: methionyl-tRNA formyltransferase [Acidimicrobiia bacterium]
MKAVFLGTPHAAVPALTALSQTATVEVVVTRPDRPRGRSGRPQPSAVKVAAESMGLHVAQPETIAGLEDVLDTVGGFDVALVVAFGMLISPSALARAPNRFVNLHFSILPRWRGAAPVQRALLAGDERTGVTLMRMDEGLDTGPSLVTVSTAISAADDAESLTARLARIGAVMVGKSLGSIGGLVAVPQDPDRATTAPKIRTDERWVDLAGTPASVLAAVRGLAPWPGAWVRHPTGGVRIIEAEDAGSQMPSGDLQLGADGLQLGLGAGAVRLVRVQPEGKRPMGGVDWARGLRGDLGRMT